MAFYSSKSRVLRGAIGMVQVRDGKLILRNSQFRQEVAQFTSLHPGGAASRNYSHPSHHWSNKFGNVQDPNPGLRISRNNRSFGKQGVIIALQSKHSSAESHFTCLCSFERPGAKMKRSSVGAYNAMAGFRRMPGPVPAPILRFTKTRSPRRRAGDMRSI